jgi:hypothetical protein
MAMITVTSHTDTPLTSSTAIMTYTSVLNPLLSSPAQTQEPEFKCLPLLHFWLQLPTIYMYKPGNSLSLHYSFLCLGTHVTPLQMLSLMTSTQSLQHHSKAVSGVQIIITNLAHDHIIDGLFIQCYTKTEIISSMQGHIDQYPETQLV